MESNECRTIDVDVMPKTEASEAAFLRPFRPTQNTMNNRPKTGEVHERRKKIMAN
jgi:hypothetical protein